MKKIKVAVDTTENVSDEDFLKVHEELHRLSKANIEYKDFCDDAEKMVDFLQLSKEEFLESYSYMTEEEYLLTSIKIKEKSNGK
tara:strand:+ start:253 stop:504 length:252 start_codon:yes stop_codon:yes gene_type:complete